MTKIDERSTVPRVDEHARRRLARALDRPDVVSVSLVGSHARGGAGPLSDIDVAVWLDPALSASDRSAAQLELGVVAARALGTDEVDLIVLTGAPPLLASRAMRDGVRILERDRDDSGEPGTPTSDLRRTRRLPPRARRNSQTLTLGFERPRGCAISLKSHRLRTTAPCGNS